jgi:Protein-disulfide isomerase
MKLTSTDHIQGSPSAPVVLVEYGDYECSYCGQAYPIVKRLQREFGNKLAFVFRNFPIVRIHRHAVDAACAAEAAAIQGKFWEMHDVLYENQTHLHVPTLIGYAKELGLDVEKFEKDFQSDAVINKVKSDMESGMKAGVQGTPTFFVNGRYFGGNWATTEFDEYIESLL